MMSFLRHMSVPQSIRSWLPLLIGLVIGAVGAALFEGSMPGAMGSSEERAHKLEIELKRARNRITALEATESAARARWGWRKNAGSSGPLGNSPQRGPRQTFADGARSIAEDIRDGRPVNPDDIFRASKPLLRDLAPLFDRMRVRQQQQMIDSMTGELARKYALPPQSQALLKQWFVEKTNEEATRWSDLVANDQTRLEDVMRASRDVRPDEGLDTFMEGVLSGDQLAAFKTERLAERAARVQQEADMKVQRLDSIVGLDETQRDQVFAVVARGSRDYDPTMRLEGAGGELEAAPVGNRQAAILAVLKPDQRAAYEAERQHRREEAAKDLEAMGLTLPPDWEMLDEGGFK